VAPNDDVVLRRGRREEGKGKRESAFRKEGWEGGAAFSLSLPLLALLALLALLLLRRKTLWVAPFSTSGRGQHPN